MSEEITYKDGTDIEVLAERTKNEYIFRRAREEFAVNYDFLANWEQLTQLLKRFEKHKKELIRECGEKGAEDILNMARSMLEEEVER